MKLKLLTGIPLTLILAATWEIGNNTAKVPVMAQTAERECVHIGYITEVTGNVRLQRFGVGEFSPTSLSGKLCSDDQLQVAGSGQATFDCFAKKVAISIPPGATWEVNAQCPKPTNSIPSPEGPIFNPCGNQGKLNIITACNNTSLLNFKPMFRWHQVDGATRYTVRLKGGLINWTIPDITKTELAYPPEQPQLEYGTTYSIRISAQNDKFNNDKFNKDLAQETVVF